MYRGGGLFSFRSYGSILLLILVCSCNQDRSKKTESPIHFTSLSSAQTHIAFNNTIVENDSVNLISNAYAYMGSGVGIGDFNNDGLPDVFMGGNTRSAALYINKGKLVFEDITRAAGLTTAVWITGVSVVDINNDGFDDIYLCVSGSRSAQKRKNLLFVNNRDLSFSEQAAEYGLDDTLYSTQAVFFDYDRDGDLDMYLVNHLLDHRQSNAIVAPDRSGRSPARDRLFKNTGLRKGTDHPWYEDVSVAAGIVDDGYGLGVVVSDVNRDGWPDLYVTNDYLANDRLWINNRNGTFSNTIARSMKHQSYSSMGVDAGDVNNDGLPDLVSLDMQPEDNYRKKMMFSFLNYDRYVLERNAGYQDEYIRNMLQMNNGVRTIADTVVPFFSETGQMAGISETDWSWSVLMADFDNDGFKDMHITNGLGRDMINNDFISFVFAADQKQYSGRADMNKAFNQRLALYGTVKLNNYCYHNNSDGRFDDITRASGFTDSAISNGGAYADLDNDGDLDLVVNNINHESFLMRNDARLSPSDTAHHYLTLMLTGDSLNKNGFGAQVSVYNQGSVQLIEQDPARGYLSTVDKRLHFGLGKQRLIDSLRIIWPDGKSELLSRVPTDTILNLDHHHARVYTSGIPDTAVYFAESGVNGIDFTHRETFYYDYGVQQLLPQKYSQLGPFLAVGDVNRDGLEDFFISGASKQPGKIFIQKLHGQFESCDLVRGQKVQEDLGALFFDADGDGDQDLVVNSGSNEFGAGSLNYLPRLYKNDGKGNFTIDPSAFPQTMSTSSQPVCGADYDGDGDTDLFIGGRISPDQYPEPPQSYLLRNDGGRFSIVTPDVCPELEHPGMITASLWTDLNGDHRPDLVVAGEWTAVRFFLNENGRLKEWSPGLKTISGQWRSLTAADLDQDGDIDIVAGNLGLNTKYKVSHDQPMMLFAKDIDQNGSIDPVLAYYIRNKDGTRILYPASSRDQFAAQVPAIKKKYLYHQQYALADMDQLFSGLDQDDLVKLVCDETRSVWFENKGGTMVMHPLPPEAQIAPVNGIVCADINHDGKPDLILAGNEYQTEVSTGRYDASYGLLLTGNGKGVFSPVGPARSGLIIDGDVKDLKIITTENKQRLLLAAINDEKLKVFQLKEK